MCLLVLAYKTDSPFPFVLATNRDEFYRRPTRPAQFWKKYPNLLAGKDMEAGGTWLGITKDHRFAALTNYRDIHNIKKDAPSRGKIVTDFLTGGMSVHEYFEHLKPQASSYNGFNLLLGTTEDLYYFNNQHLELNQVQPGFHTLSNAFLDSGWPKSEQALRNFKSVLQSNPEDPDDYFRFLQNSDPFPDSMLPSTGLPLAKERMVSSVFIQSEDYGTRSSTLIFTNAEGEIQFIEKSYKPGSKEAVKTVKFNF